MSRISHRIRLLFLGISAAVLAGCGGGRYENLSPRATAEDALIAHQDHEARLLQRGQQEAAYFATRR